MASFEGEEPDELAQQGEHSPILRSDVRHKPSPIYPGWTPRRTAQNEGATGRTQSSSSYHTGEHSSTMNAITPYHTTQESSKDKSMAVEKPRPSYRGLATLSPDESIRKRVRSAARIDESNPREATDNEMSEAQQHLGERAQQREKSMPNQELQQREEPFGAQVLRRLHSDGCTLMQEYDEMMGVTEHPHVKKHLAKRLGHLDELLTNTEALFKKHYKGFPPLEEALSESSQEVEPGEQGTKSEFTEEELEPRPTQAQAYRQEVESGRAQPWYRIRDRRHGLRRPQETSGNDFRPRTGEKATYLTEEAQNIANQRSFSDSIRDEQNTNDAEEMVHRPPVNRLTSGDAAPSPGTNQHNPDRRQGRKSLGEVAVQQAKDIQELTKTLQIITSKL